MSSPFDPKDVDSWSQRMRNIMDEMLNRHFVEWRPPGTWKPPTNVYETEDSYCVCMDLAGLDHEDIVVEYVDNQLVVSGKRCQPRFEGLGEPLNVFLLEIQEGPFHRMIELPEPVDEDRIDAATNQGFLWVILPKAKR